ncbi:MAG: AAA family ATPase [Saprospiraceae bacterium]
MILQSLHLRFYKQYRYLDLEFREGLVCIVGRNGAGKSTLFNAIVYALFGKEDGAKEHIRTAHTPHSSPVEVSLNFFLDNNLYRVERLLKGKRSDAQALLYRNDSLIADGVTAVNEEIQKRLGLDSSGFRNTAFAAQKELDALSRTGGESRKKMIRQMLGLEKLDRIQILVRQDVRDIANQIKGQSEALLPPEEVEKIRQEIERMLQMAQEQDRAIASEQTEYDKMKALDVEIKCRFDAQSLRKDQHQKAIAEREALKSRLQTLSAEYARLQTTQSDLAKRKEAHLQNKPDYAALQKLREAITQQEDQLERFRLTRELASRIYEKKEAIAKQTELLTHLDAELETERDNNLLIAKIAQEIAELERRLEELGAQIRLNGEHIKIIAHRIAERKKRIDDLRKSGKNGSCPTCLRPLLEAYDQVMDDMLREIEHEKNVEIRDLDAERRELESIETQLKKDLTLLQKDREAAIIRRSKLQDQRKRREEESARSAELNLQLERLLAQLQSVGPGAETYDANLHRELKSRYEIAGKTIAAWEKEDESLKRDIPAIEKNLSNNEQSRRETETSIHRCNENIREIAFNPATFDAVNRERNEFAQKLSRQAEILSEARAKGESMRRDADKLRARLDDNQRMLNQIQEKIQERDALIHLENCIKQFKDETLARVGPAISAEAGALFQRITEGKYEGIHVDENFDFWIFDGGTPYPVSRFSGGETDLACFCLRIAVTKAVATLAGAEQHLGFLGFDEIFGSQDEIRRENILAALQLLKEQFRQIYVVTHIESVRDAFQHILEVRQEQTGSRALWSS